ncbi:MAG: Phospho-2-dehydro-3-deoxyheptonate aldolase, Tyr-sensitive [Chlamydiia bacterium]|nr:Phospho-2-dehydro-3-deoxyheptonate aldolase, Tyr-sensitive [Chlamydiia bacterium]
MTLVESIRAKIKHRLQNRSKTFFAIVGPCSIYCIEETILFAKKLKLLQVELGNEICLVMRAFVEKSRTSHSWKGFVYQPDIHKPEDILKGLELTKKLFSSLPVPLAMEFIEPSIYPHLAPFISWGFIGARTATSTTHRILASNSPIPFGFKHSLDGDINTSINSILIAKQSHCILTENSQTFSSGNPFTHVVLRGGKTPNYDKETVTLIKSLSEEQDIHSPILIDCSHGNSHNKPDDQKTVFLDVLDQYIENPINILGVMIESNLYKGAAKKTKEFGVSYTDPCLNFEETRSLLLYAKEKITSSHRTEELNLPTSCAYNH